MITHDIALPTEEELTVEEVNISGAALKASAFHFGKYCETQRDEFVLCRNEERDPRKCINQGKAVTSCALEFFRKVKKSCLTEFNQYAYCLHQGSREMNLWTCRESQGVLDKCILDNLGQERPYYGYFNEPKVLKTNRPRPEPRKQLEFSGTPTPILPETQQEIEERKADHRRRLFGM